MSPSKVLWALLILAICVSLAFMLVGIQGSLAFALELRARKLLGLVVVGFAISISTVLFQTITDNRILTPSIIGFDALYILIQTLLAATLGFVRINAIDPMVRFALETAIMVAGAAILYRWLFAGAKRDLQFLALGGLIFGALVRSVSTFLQRVLDPGEFIVLQDRMFASFNAVEPTMLSVALVIVTIVSVIGWRIRHSFDVLGLGRENAINLGLDYRPTVNLILVLIAILVSVSTSLVGPVTFFGLLVANMTYRLIASSKHSVILPAAVLISIICLVGGQIVLERLFGFDTSLSIIIEFLGGIIFIVLLVRRTYD